MFTRSLYFLPFFSLVFFTSGCVDSIPFVRDEIPTKKLFIECELQAGHSILAFVSYPHFLNGNLSSLPPIDTSEIRLTLSEANKDYVIPFKYNKKKQLYFIDSSDFLIRSGTRYILQGNIQNSPYEISVMTDIPSRFPYDSIQVLQTKYETLPNSKIYTFSIIRVYFNRLKTPENYYLHFAFFNKILGDAVNCNPESDKNAFFKLTHKPGLLLELNRVEKNDFVDISIDYEGDDSLRELNFMLNNTTKAYYDYQKFKTNSPSYPTPSANPSIAAFNIQSEDGYGTFSSLYKEVVNISLK